MFGSHFWPLEFDYDYDYEFDYDFDYEFSWANFYTYVR